MIKFSRLLNRLYKILDGRRVLFNRAKSFRAALVLLAFIIAVFSCNNIVESPSCKFIAAAASAASLLYLSLFNFQGIQYFNSRHIMNSADCKNHGKPLVFSLVK